MTLFQKLQAAGLPVVSATEDGNIQMGAMTPEQEETYHLIILEHFNPQRHAEYLDLKGAKSSLQDEYTTAITTLTQIRDATNPTNAQVIAAVKYMAKVLIFLIKIVARHFRN